MIFQRPAISVVRLFLTLYWTVLQLVALGQGGNDDPSGREMAERHALVKGGNKALMGNDLALADSLFTQALGLWGDNETYLLRAETRRRMGNRAGFCADLKSGRFGDMRATFDRECQRRDSVPFAVSGLSSSRFPGVLNVSRTLDFAEGRTYIRLYDARDSLSAAFFLDGMDTLFFECDSLPFFGSDKDDRATYLHDNVKYPAEAQDAGIRGTVYLAFTIRRDGSMTDLRVVRSADQLLDAEALRVLQSMTEWTPGRYAGRPIDFAFTLPVKFSLR